jgi:signal peptidase I
VPVLVGTILWLLLLVVVGSITAAKGKWWTLVLGLVLFPAWIVGAIRLAKPNSLWERRFYDQSKRMRAEERAARPGIGRFVTVGAAILGLLLVLGSFVTLKVYLVGSSAMEPTLRCERPHPGCSASEADRVAAVRLFLIGDPGRGDIVSFELPASVAARCGTDAGVFVKRVVGLPGDTVEERSGVIYLNGSELAEPYVEPENRDVRSMGPTTIPSDAYYLLGDNRSSSCDSRVFGPVQRDALVAKVFFRYWPFSALGIP